MELLFTPLYNRIDTLILDSVQSVSVKTLSVDSKRTGENLILSAYPKKKVTWEPMHSSTMKAADFSGPG